MRLFLLLCCAVMHSSIAAALPGKDALIAVKQCIMGNDIAQCHAHMTPESYPLFDRFFSYKLMPCLPTDFTYVTQTSDAGLIQVRASIPESDSRVGLFWLVFVPSPKGLLLDLPQTLHKGFGKNWENKIQMSEQLYLMMRQNMGGNLSCDMLYGLLKPQYRK